MQKRGVINADSTSESTKKNENLLSFSIEELQTPCTRRYSAAFLEPPVCV